MTDAPPLRLAVLGCGAIADVHARTLGRLRAPVTFTFASRDPARARDFAARHGGRAVDSYEHALEAPDIDAVLVATPPAMHLRLAVAAMEAGKDVVVEKPAFMSTVEFDAAVAQQTASGRRLLIAENYFYKPLRAKLEALVRQQAVGRPLFLSVDATKRQPAEGWRGDAAASGGPLLEGGVHWIDLMANVGFEVTGVSGAAVDGASRDMARSLLATFTYAGGAAGALRFSWDAHAPLRGARLSHLQGTDGAVTFESNGAFVLARGRRRTLWAPRPADAAGTRPMWRDFLRALGGGPDAAFTTAHGRRDIELVELIRASLGDQP